MSGTRHLTPDEQRKREARIIQLRQQGLSIKVISQRMGISQTWVSEICKLAAA